MPNLTESATFDSTVYRIDQTDPVQGWNGSDIGISNQQAQALANRTQWLKKQVDLGSRFTAFYPFAPASSGQVQVLTPGDVKGTLIRVNTASFDGVLTMPLASTCEDFSNVAVSVEPGSGFQFKSANGKFCILGPSGSDTFLDADSGQTLGNYTIFPWSIVRVTKVSATQWMVWKESSVDLAPPGLVSAWAVNSQPYGWLECNGSAISRTNYARLFDQIGTTFGAGNGTTTFNIPDLRGEFIRGWDNGRGVDNNSFTIQATTTNGSANVTNADTTGLVAGMSVSGTGIPVGATISSITNSTTFVLSANATASANFVTLTFSSTRAFGSSQLDMFKKHEHKISRLSNVVNSTSPTTATLTDWEAVSGVQSTDNVQPVGGAETRPRNVALMLCIKF